MGASIYIVKEATLQNPKRIFRTIKRKLNHMLQLPTYKTLHNSPEISYSLSQKGHFSSMLTKKEWIHTTNKICQHQFSPKVRIIISEMHLRIFYFFQCPQPKRRNVKILSTLFSWWNWWILLWLLIRLHLWWFMWEAILILTWNCKWLPNFHC